MFPTNCFHFFNIQYKFHHIQDKIPKIAEKHSQLLPAEPTVVDIQNSWDELVKINPSIAQDADVVGTILPNEKSVIAGPNNRRFILRPINHSDTYKQIHHKPAAEKRRAPKEHDITMEVPAKKNTLVTYNKITKEGTKNGKNVRNFLFTNTMFNFVLLFLVVF